MHRRIAGFRGTPKRKGEARRGLGVEACKLDATGAAPNREHGQITAGASAPDEGGAGAQSPAEGLKNRPEGAPSGADKHYRREAPTRTAKAGRPSGAQPRKRRPERPEPHARRAATGATGAAGVSTPLGELKGALPRARQQPRTPRRTSEGRGSPDQRESGRNRAKRGREGAQVVRTQPGREWNFPPLICQREKKKRRLSADRSPQTALAGWGFHGCPFLLTQSCSASPIRTANPRSNIFMSL